MRKLKYIIFSTEKVFFLLRYQKKNVKSCINYLLIKYLILVLLYFNLVHYYYFFFFIKRTLGNLDHWAYICLVILHVRSGYILYENLILNFGLEVCCCDVLHGVGYGFGMIMEYFGKWFGQVETWSDVVVCTAFGEYMFNGNLYAACCAIYLLKARSLGEKIHRIK